MQSCPPKMLGRQETWALLTPGRTRRGVGNSNSLVDTIPDIPYPLSRAFLLFPPYDATGREKLTRVS